MTQALRVMHFVQRFSPLTETFLYDSVRALERQNVDCRILTLERVAPETRPFPSVDVEPWPSRWNARTIAAGLLARLRLLDRREVVWPELRRRLTLRVRAVAPHLIHAHFGPAAVWIAPVAARAGVPLVVSFYGADISQLPLDPFWRSRYPGLWQAAGAVTVLSDVMREAVVGLGCPVEKVRVIRLSRDLRGLRPRPAPTSVSRFVSVGRLTEKKGHLDTIAAFERLLASGADVRLRIVGEGKLREALSVYIRTHGLDEHIELVGALDNAEVLREMTRADAFILCSRTSAKGDQEGTPTVFVEAQALNLPCVGTLHAGIPEMIPEENHWLLAPEGDVPEIADRVRALIDSAPEDMARIVTAGREKVQRDFDLDREAERLKDLYRLMLSGPSARQLDE